MYCIGIFSRDFIECLNELRKSTKLYKKMYYFMNVIFKII